MRIRQSLANSVFYDVKLTLRYFWSLLALLVVLEREAAAGGVAMTLHAQTEHVHDEIEQR